MNRGKLFSLSLLSGAENGSLAACYRTSIFGTVFYLLEDEGMGPAMGLAGDNRKYPAEAHVRGFVAHLAFGLVAAGVARLLGVTPKSRR